VRVVFLGPPGSGKGTQAKIAGKRLGLPSFSTGDMLRKAVQAGTPLGRQTRDVMAKGELVPDETVLALIREAAASAEARSGFLLDGFPRTLPQAEGLEKMLSERGQALDAVLNLVVPDEKLVSRLVSRGEGRADDRPETVRERLRVYREKTEPLTGFYQRRGLLVSVDGVGEIPEVAERIARALGPARQGVA
jgi:adenylate kinase